jgi:hypothetical protein
MPKNIHKESPDILSVHVQRILQNAYNELLSIFTPTDFKMFIDSFTGN